MPAGPGHSDGCAAANGGARGDGLGPAGADTPGSGVLAATPVSVAFASSMTPSLLASMSSAVGCASVKLFRGFEI